MLDQRKLGPLLRWLTLAAREPASAQPGQFVMLRCSAGDSSDPFLRRSFFIADADPNSGTVSLFYRVADPATRWLSAAGPGTRIDLLGPLGQPLTPASKARNLLLVAENCSIAPLLFLARRSSCSMLLIHQADAPELELPPYLLPPEVEYVLADMEIADLLAQPFGNSGLPPAQWSDRIAAAGGSTLAIKLAGALGASRLRRTRGLAHFVLTSPLPCGVGLCGGCRIGRRRGKGGSRLLCLDGPAVELFSLG